jgi:hypothetical protein
MKYIYLLLGLMGLTGTTCIAYRVFDLTSISCTNMLLVFSAACLCLAVMMIGFYGFIETIRESRK